MTAVILLLHLRKDACLVRPDDRIRHILAPLPARGRCARVSRPDGVDLAIYVVVDLLEERVVELDSQVGRPSDCLKCER